MSVWVKVPVQGPEEAYYWNPETQATSWRTPEGVEVVWVAQKTDREGSKSSMYFWNKRTRETTWEPPVPGRGRGAAAAAQGSGLAPPAAASAAPAAASAAPPAAAGAPVQAQSSGRPAWCFQVNDHFSGPSYDDGNVPSERPPFYDASGSLCAEGGEWIEVIGHESSSNGRNYFINYRKCISTWNLKPGVSPTWRAYQHATGSWYYVQVHSGETVWKVSDMFLDKLEETEEDGVHARWIQFGAGMMIQGCSARMSRFNHQVGTVLGRTQDRRVLFQLPDCQGGTILHLLPRNVCPLEKGAIVEITGLTSNATLNGITGTVIDVDYEKQRYIVRLPTLEQHGSAEKAVRATKVLARTRLWDLDVTVAPTWLQWRGEQDSLFVDAQGYHRKFSVHMPLRFATTARETGTASLIRWPLLVYMHGAGASSFLKHSKKSLQSAGLTRCADDFVIISPHCDWKWNDQPKPWVNELVATLRAAEWIDHQRIYLTGCSMGGMGTWELGAERPELYAAVAPVAAYHNGERTEHIARRLRGTPVFVIHSLHDGVCPHSKEVPLWTLLREEGNRHLKVSLAHHVDHTFMFERAYCDDATIYEWLLRWTTKLE